MESTVMGNISSTSFCMDPPSIDWISGKQSISTFAPRRISISLQCSEIFSFFLHQYFSSYKKNYSSLFLPLNPETQPFAPLSYSISFINPPKPQCVAVSCPPVLIIPPHPGLPNKSNMSPPHPLPSTFPPPPPHPALKIQSPHPLPPKMTQKPLPYPL